MGRCAFVVGLASLVGLTGCGAGVAGETQASTPSATLSPSLGVIPAGTAPIEPGTYLIPKSSWSVADFTISFPRRGWTVQYGHTYNKHFDSADDEFGFYPVVVDEIFTDACEGTSGDITEVGPTVDDLAAALVTQLGTRASGPFEDTLGGHPALRVDLAIPRSLDLKPCNLGDIGLQIWYSAPADKYFVLLPHAFASVYILDIDGQRQVFLVQVKAATSQSDRQQLEGVLDSIRIEA